MIYYNWCKIKWCQLKCYYYDPITTNHVNVVKNIMSDDICNFVYQRL